VPSGLLDQALAGVDQDDREVRRRRPRDHVARVLHVARGVRDDEGAPGGGEIAVRDVDGDALLALRPKAIGQQGQFRALEALAAARLDDVAQLVVGYLLGVVEQPPDQRRLPVVDAAGGRQPQELARRGLGNRHQK